MSQSVFITPDQLLAHWQGHRGLTRRVIEAFPEDQLFTFSVGGMRPFGEIGRELLAMDSPMVKGMATGEWAGYTPSTAATRAELLAEWDAHTEEMNEYWPKIPVELFQQTVTAFGQYTDLGEGLILYCVDNEVHHRGQGYVYLRALGIEPPPFYERP